MAPRGPSRIGEGPATALRRLRESLHRRTGIDDSVSQPPPAPTSQPQSLSDAAIRRRLTWFAGCSAVTHDAGVAGDTSGPVVRDDCQLTDVALLSQR
jgi:hypothetical protein